MEEVITYFKNKKNLINLLVLLVAVVGLPLLTDAIRTQKIFLSRAAADPIVFTGPNVTTLNNQKVLKLNDQGKAVVDLELTSTLGPPAPVGVASVENQTLPMSFLPEDGLISEVKAQDVLDPCLSNGGEFSSCVGSSVLCYDPIFDQTFGPVSCLAGSSCKQALQGCVVSGGGSTSCTWGYHCSDPGVGGDTYCNQGYPPNTYKCLPAGQCGLGDGCAYNTNPPPPSGSQCPGDNVCGAYWGPGASCNSLSGINHGDGCYGGCQLRHCSSYDNQDFYCNGQWGIPSGTYICSPNQCGVYQDGCIENSNPPGGGQPTICRQAQINANDDGYDYCNNPANNSGLPTGGVYQCDPINPDPTPDFPHGDGCYIPNPTAVCGIFLVPQYCVNDEVQANPVRYCMNTVPSQNSGLVAPAECMTGGTNCYLTNNDYPENELTASTIGGQCPVAPPPTDVTCSLDVDNANQNTSELSLNETATILLDNPAQKQITFKVKSNQKSNSAIWLGNNPVGSLPTSCDEAGNCSLNYTANPLQQVGQDWIWTQTLPSIPGGDYTRKAKLFFDNNVTCTTGEYIIQVLAQAGTDRPSVSGIVPDIITSPTQRYTPGSSHSVKVNFSTPNNSGHVDLYYFGPFPDNHDHNTLNASTPAKRLDNANKGIGITQSGSPISWNVPTQPGKYYYVANGHSIGANQEQSDWLYPSDLGCAWDKKTYRQTGETEPQNCIIGTPGCNPVLAPMDELGLCSNSGQVEFWVGVAGGPGASPSPSGGPPGGCGNYLVCPTNPAICSNNLQCQGGGGCPAGQFKCANNQCAPSCGPVGGSPPPSGAACPAGQVKCPNGQCAIFCTGSPAPSGSAGGPGASASPTAPPGGVKTTHFRVAEDPIALNTAIWQVYDTEPERLTFPFANSTPGVKSVWVEYKTNQNPPKTDRRSKTITLLGPEPGILGCNLVDITDKSVTFNIVGTNFGTETGTVKSGQTNLVIKHWTPANIQAIFNNPPTGQSFPVELTTDVGQMTSGQCSSISQLALGAKLFCRQPGKFDVTGVNLTLVEASAGGKLVKEVVTINKEGIVQGLKARIEEGKKYKLGIEAPKSLRRVQEITGQLGTTNVPNMVLPIGDIFPLAGGDGVINTPDKSEQNREWIIAVDAKDRAADLNQDLRVNSVDWACMRFDFGKSDDPEPSAGP